MQKILGFSNVNYVTPKGIVKGNVGVKNGRIALDEKGDGFLTIPEGYFLAPGFLDEHIHGAGGADVMDGEVSSLRTISSMLAKEGVTSFLATTMTESLPRIEKAITSINAARKETLPGAKLAGIHLEGPYISSSYSGAQEEKNIRKPNAEEFDRLVRLSENSIREVTFAYEEDEGGKFLSYCLKHGITPSLGHSNATGEVAWEGFDRGISCVTHLFNAQRPFHHRDVGVSGAGLLRDGVSCELIADLRHVSPEAVELVFRCKKKDDIILISDATEAKGLSEGAKAHLGTQPIVVEDGVAKLLDGTIAGSILCLDQALRNLAPLAKGYSFAELVNLVTINPAKNLGLDGEIGSIEEGKRADFVILDETFHVHMTIVDGRIVYQKEGFAF